MFQFLNALRCTAGNRYCCCCCFYYSCKMTVSIVQSDNRTIRHQRRETKPKRSKASKTKRKRKHQTEVHRLYVYLLYMPLSPWYFPNEPNVVFLWFFSCCCTKCEEAVSYICNEKCAHYYHISPKQSSSLGFLCVLHHFLIGISLMLFRWCAFSINARYI